MADHVADDQRDPGAGQRDHVEPVAADADAGRRRAGSGRRPPPPACRAAAAAAGCAAGSARSCARGCSGGRCRCRRRPGRRAPRPGAGRRRRRARVAGGGRRWPRPRVMPRARSGTAISEWNCGDSILGRAARVLREPARGGLEVRFQHCLARLPAPGLRRGGHEVASVADGKRRARPACRCDGHPAQLSVRSPGRRAPRRAARAPAGRRSAKSANRGHAPPPPVPRAVRAHVQGGADPAPRPRTATPGGGAREYGRQDHAGVPRRSRRSRSGGCRRRFGGLRGRGRGAWRHDGR